MWKPEVSRSHILRTCLSRRHIVSCRWTLDILTYSKIINISMREWTDINRRTCNGHAAFWHIRQNIVQSNVFLLTCLKEILNVYKPYYLLYISFINNSISPLRLLGKLRIHTSLDVRQINIINSAGFSHIRLWSALQDWSNQVFRSSASFTLKVIQSSPSGFPALFGSTPFQKIKLTEQNHWISHTGNFDTEHKQKICS